MASKGYLYVLANSSMTNLVKVGKTVRLPSERAEELSKVTGVPTPFIVVYEQLFHDCDAAETFMHALLSRKGYRVAENREFFNAPVAEVVRALATAPGRIEEGAACKSEVVLESDEVGLTREPDELDDLNLPDEVVAPPWQDLWKEAQRYCYGLGDCLQDYDEALKLYRQAAKLGCTLAYQAIGDMYRYGWGVDKSKKEALSWYKEGARKGNYFCYLQMAELFSEVNDTISYNNREKCLSLFFSSRKSRVDYNLESLASAGSELSSHIQSYFRYGGVPGKVISDNIHEFIDEIDGCTRRSMEYLVDPEFSEFRESRSQLLSRVLEWLDQHRS